jgi:hypothetical protein
MPPATTAKAPQAPLVPLNGDERLLLTSLLARDSLDKGPATRIGDPYEALVNLSVPRRGDFDHGSDLVMAGETVYLTPDEARLFERHGNRDGRQVPVIRKLSGPEGSHAELPRLLPRHLSGRMFRPAVPPPNTDLPRPDPVESSHIKYVEPAGEAPESGGAVAVDPAEMASHLSDAVAQDALDLPPGARTRRR